MKRPKLKTYRQGDVVIEQIEALPPAGLKRQPPGRIILAHGEVTGHHHAIEERDAADWWKEEKGDTQFLAVNEAGATLTHQEHATIALPPGNYRVRRQREYTPTEIRNVAD